jgi:hypothetical protein
MTWTTEIIVSNNSSIASVFVATGMYLLSHCLTMIKGIYKDTHEESRLTEELLKVFSMWSDLKSYKEKSSLVRTVVSSVTACRNQIGKRPNL